MPKTPHDPNIPRVLNNYKLKAGETGVYIGRPSKWRNPFPITTEFTRDQSCDAFDAYLAERPELLADAMVALKGRNLICFCAPKRCHGDAWLRLVNALPAEPEVSDTLSAPTQLA